MEQLYKLLTIAGLLCAASALYVFRKAYYPAVAARGVATAPVSLLQRYVRINTSHPDADYARAVELFKQQANLDAHGQLQRR